MTDRRAVAVPAGAMRHPNGRLIPATGRAFLSWRDATRDWLAAGGRSIADPYLYVLLRWAKAKEVDLGGMDGLQRFFAHMQADAGVKAAEHAQGL